MQHAIVCSSSLLAQRIGLYTASLVSLTDVLIGWRASDCDASTHIVTYPNKHGEYPPSPTWRASPTWRKQKAFPLPVGKSREFPAFFRGRGQSYARRHWTWHWLLADLAIFLKIADTHRTSDTKLMNMSKCSDSKDIRIDIAYISFRCKNIGSMSNRCQSNGLCYLGGSHKSTKKDNINTRKQHTTYPRV